MSFASLFLGLVLGPQTVIVHYKLTGCLVERDKPLPLKFAVQDPERYTSQRLAALLKEINIGVSGKIRVGTAPEKQRKLIAMHQSEAWGGQIRSVNGLTATVRENLTLDSGTSPIL